jgi:hypothetical protein
MAQNDSTGTQKDTTASRIIVDLQSGTVRPAERAALGNSIQSGIFATG